MIEYIDVHKAFDLPVLSGVDLKVETRETLSIVGPSGTGKSVLLKTTNGLLVPDRGDVRIDGVSVYGSARDGLAGIRRKVGYVFQYAALFDSMNVFENICTGLPYAEEKRARTPVTSIVVTHDIEQALEISDRVALLTHGKLRFVGTPAAFRASSDPVVRAFADRRAAAAAALQLVAGSESDRETEEVS